MIFTVVIFIITLLILVVIHELGHFLVAKKFNIKVLEFGFGIPPRIWGKRVGETLVSINWLPFGGFVRLLGEDEVDKEILENKRSFAAQNVWKRIAVVVAGVVMNLILAWLLFYIVLGSQGFKTEFQLIFDHKFIGAEQKNESFILIAAVSPESPADSVGIKRGDRVVEVNDQAVGQSGDLINKTKEMAGQEIILKLTDQDNQSREVKITPRIEPPTGQGPLGIALDEVHLASIEYKTPVQKILAGPVHSLNFVIYSAEILGKFVGESFQTRDFQPVSRSVAGPVGITVLVNDIFTQIKDPLIPYLNFVAFLSLNLAVMNVLPIPALDGGRLFFLLIEAITRKKVHVNIERYIHSIGMVILLALMLLITFSDIRRIFP